MEYGTQSRITKFTGSRGETYSSIVQMVKLNIRNCILINIFFFRICLVLIWIWYVSFLLIFANSFWTIIYRSVRIYFKNENMFLSRFMLFFFLFKKILIKVCNSCDSYYWLVTFKVQLITEVHGIISLDWLDNQLIIMTNRTSPAQNKMALNYIVSAIQKWLSMIWTINSMHFLYFSCQSIDTNMFGGGLILLIIQWSSWCSTESNETPSTRFSNINQYIYYKLSGSTSLDINKCVCLCELVRIKIFNSFLRLKSSCRFKT